MNQDEGACFQTISLFTKDRAIKMNKNYLNKILVITALFTINAPVMAESTIEPVDPPTLRGVMQELDKNMQMISHGISLEDWQLVEKMALAIADHPKPPMGDRMRIKKLFGTDMFKFKSHDIKTHSSAMALSEIAAKRDGDAVITEFAKLQSACLACHQEFREPFRKHFYAQK